MARKKNMRYPAEIGEAITLAVSIMIFAALLIYLLYSLKNDPEDYLLVTAQAETSIQVPDSKDFVIPVTIRNNGPRSISYLQLVVILAGNPENRIDVEMNYLSRRSSRKVFLVTNRLYAPDDIDIRPLYYKLD